MFTILLVDDEKPALRYLQTIIDKYLPGFTVVQQCASAESAYAYLEEHPVDVLITDIRMSGENGVDLARRVRGLQREIHIVIISGYGEFEYAKGAIQAAVDAYILKPVAIDQLVDTMRKIEAALSAERTAQRERFLTALCRSQSVDMASAARLFGFSRFSFALIRWGCRMGNLPAAIQNVTLFSYSNEKRLLFNGRDRSENILILSAEAPVDFEAEVRAYIEETALTDFHTIIYGQGGYGFGQLAELMQKAFVCMDNTIVLGKSQVQHLSAAAKLPRPQVLPSNDVRKISRFISTRQMGFLHDMLVNLGREWDKAGLQQTHADSIIQQIIHEAMSESGKAFVPKPELQKELRQCALSVQCYADLMEELYQLLFGAEEADEKKMGGEELCRLAVDYIQSHYTQPIGVQDVCNEIGISQTYLNRLLRKYADTSFNAFLTQLRINAAIEMLETHKEIRIRDVAACVGYDDQGYFSKIFRQVTGKTPSEYISGQK